MNIVPEKINILREDLSQTLSFIDKCDDHIFKIKNWAIITSSAVIAFSVSQDHDLISLANLALLFAFIYLELIYKSLQNTTIEHSTDISMRIDLFLESPDREDLLKGYNHGFGGKLKYPSIPRVFGILQNKHQRHILNFYCLLALFSIAAFVVATFVS